MNREQKQGGKKEQEKIEDQHSYIKRRKISGFKSLMGKADDESRRCTLEKVAGKDEGHDD